MKKITSLLFVCLMATACFTAMAVETSNYVIDEGSSLMGDVNSDGSVNAADVTALYNYILNGDQTYLANSDVNNDGAVNAGDVTAVYNIILGGEGGSTGGSEIVMTDFVDNSLTSYNENDYRHQWVDGDVIYLAVDPDHQSVCQNVYAMVRTGGKWMLQDVQGNSKVGFNINGGTVDAVYVQHADVAESRYNYIPLVGDVAVSNHSGSYTAVVKDNKICVTLKDLKLYHFVSRIDVEGAYEGDYFYESVTHLDAMQQVTCLTFEDYNYHFDYFETSFKAPVIDLENNTHKGHAYGVWKKGSRTKDGLTLNYAKNNGYCYYWDYGQDVLRRGRYLASVSTPWQNDWSRDLSIRAYNIDLKDTERLNAGGSTQTVNINVGTNIVFRAYDGDKLDMEGQILSATSSTSGILDVSVSQPEQVSVTAHKAGTSTLTIKHKTKDNITVTYTFNVKVEPTLWIAGSVNGQPKIWRNRQDKSMYLRESSNYDAAVKIMAHGNTAYVMLRKSVSESFNSMISKATGAHGGGYFEEYKSGLTYAEKNGYNFPRMWVDKSGNVYYTSYAHEESNPASNVVNTTIYKNKSTILTIPNFLVSDIAVSDATGKIYVVGINATGGRGASVGVITGNTPQYFITYGSDNNYPVYFNRLYLDQNTETVYIDAQDYYAIDDNQNVFYRYNSSTGLGLFAGVQGPNGWSLGSRNRRFVPYPYGIQRVQYPFLFYGDKFYYYALDSNSNNVIMTYQLGASATSLYRGYNSNTDKPYHFDIKNGMFGGVFYDKENGFYYPMCAELNTYHGGSQMENSTGVEIYDVWMQTSLDD